MTSDKTGIAFRSSIITPGDIVKFAKIVDQSNFTNIFINESSPDLDALEICSASLGVSKGVLVGSGVIRLLEHDENLLLRRLKTLQAISGNRFVLGVGTGSPGPDPGQKIDLMLQRLQNLRKDFGSSAFPQVFIATLKTGIAKKVAGSSEGILLNFCTPEHARRVVASYKEAFSGSTEFACYLKVFYSKSDAVAKKLLVREFENYATLEQYRKMFEIDGVLPEVKSASEYLRKNGSVPSSLLRISLMNPSAYELEEYVSRFRDAGISLPCIYPYFSGDDGFEFRLEKIRSIVSA
ncbi:MAG: LLM class flavin-dependent oxidoreductase [Nitrososphaerales archaeon]|jgi:alkanesulfonate monooxygenase SsuD/methylene tetrahydromethanopterin reductase-like flavin-dependent oxidoreductase (luciferase family)